MATYKQKEKSPCRGYRPTCRPIRIVFTTQGTVFADLGRGYNHRHVQQYAAAAARKTNSSRSKVSTAVRGIKTGSIVLFGFVPIIGSFTTKACRRRFRCHINNVTLRMTRYKYIQAQVGGVTKQDLDKNDKRYQYQNVKNRACERCISKLCIRYGSKRERKRL